MKQHLYISPAKAGYHTREHLYALCVLMLWGPGLALENKHVLDEFSVTLQGIADGNAGTSEFMLCQNPNATNVRLTGTPGEANAVIFFKVLGVPLCVSFNERGIGTVQFTHQPEPF